MHSATHVAAWISIAADDMTTFKGIVIVIKLSQHLFHCSVYARAGELRLLVQYKTRQCLTRPLFKAFSISSLLLGVCCGWQAWILVVAVDTTMDDAIAIKP